MINISKIISKILTILTYQFGQIQSYQDERVDQKVQRGLSPLFQAQDP